MMGVRNGKGDMKGLSALENNIALEYDSCRVPLTAASAFHTVSPGFAPIIFFVVVVILTQICTRHRAPPQSVLEQLAETMNAL